MGTHVFAPKANHVSHVVTCGIVVAVVTLQLSNVSFAIKSLPVAEFGQAEVAVPAPVVVE
jgi:hypothetical protein